MILLQRHIGMLAGVLILTFSGWASASSQFSSLPIAHAISGVPFFPQQEYQCGPASLASVLSFWGKEVSLEDLTQEVYLPRLKGSLPLDLERAARAYGLSVKADHGNLEDLRTHIAMDHPVITFMNLGTRVFPNGHFIVVTGFNDQERLIRAHSIIEPHKTIVYETFLKGWAKTDFWMLVMHPQGPDEKP